MNCFSSVRVNPSGSSPFPTPKPFYEKAAMAFGVGVPFFSLFLGIYLCWGHGLRLVDLILMIGLYSLTILGITVGFHRMFTHRAY